MEVDNNLCPNFNIVGAIQSGGMNWERSSHSGEVENTNKTAIETPQGRPGNKGKMALKYL
jgi:hypothetical protein